MIRRPALALAVAATGTAACISVLAGWQRGGWLAERLVWVATGLVLVTSAHLLPALLRGTPALVRVMGSVLWATCLATACIGHAVFFVSAQQHAGELRVSALPAAPPPTAARSLTTVMAERAAVTAQLAAANARYCSGNCGTLEARRVTLAAKVNALDAEADDIRRLHVADDRVTTRRDALRADPVTSRLAALFGVPGPRIDVLLGLMFAAVLEGVACLLWAVALRSPSPPNATGVASPAVATVSDSVDTTRSAVMAVANSMNATHAAAMPIAVSRASGTVSRKVVIADRGDTTSDQAPRDDPIDGHVTQLARDIAAGLVRPTVADIRRHLGCSQTRATALRRQIVALNVTT